LNSLLERLVAKVRYQHVLRGLRQLRFICRARYAYETDFSFYFSGMVGREQASLGSAPKENPASPRKETPRGFNYR
jgi:hypothetical protein